MSWGFPTEPDAGGHTAGDETAAGATLADVDLSRAHPARVYNRWLRGKDHFAADRAVAEQVARIAPWAVTGARANRAFLRRAVSFLARQGITQFVDVGAGLPSAGNVHEVAQRFQPDARVCYLDNDPVVLAHARALLAGKNTIAVAGDARDPQAILADPEVRAHVDFQLPVAVLFIAVLHFLCAEDDPAGVVAAFRDVLAPGSFVVISHVADLPDGHAGSERAQATREAVKLYEELAAPFVLRTREDIAGLFAGFDLVDPGLVLAHRWRPDRRRPGPPVPVLAAVGRLLDPNASADSGPDPDSSPGPDHAPGRGPGRADPAEEEPGTGSPRGGLS
jgi:SAM-dependent methyltransferase